MQPLKPIPVKRAGKQERERQVLLGLVDLYLQYGKPIGSNKLRENGFEDISAATIRNYFAHLESEGFLKQQHSSGGRIPTDKAFHLYAEEYFHKGTVTSNEEELLRYLRDDDEREVGGYLQHAAESLSEMTNLAVFFSAPRFDRDIITDLKLVYLDTTRCLCVLLTDFGLIHTETLVAESSFSKNSIERMERYFKWRLTGSDKPDDVEGHEEVLAQMHYNEVMVRYLVGYSNFSDEDIYRTGFSRLLRFPEFSDVVTVANGLALFENLSGMRHLLRECSSTKKMKVWVGDELKQYSPNTESCSVIAIPYYVNHQIAGSIGILGPTRIPYRQLFGILRLFSEYISECLTRTIYKNKITMRQPSDPQLTHTAASEEELEDSRAMLLEDKSSNN